MHQNSLEDMLHQRYSDASATDYSKESSIFRYSAVWCFRQRSDAARVLDLGCGTGGFAQYSIDLGMPMSQYVGVDARQSQLRLAKKIEDPRVCFLDQLPTDGSFNLVIALGTMSYQLSDNAENDLFEYIALFKAATALLTERGQFALTIRTPAGQTDSRNRPYLVTTPETICEQLSLQLVRMLPFFQEESLLILSH